MSVRSEEVALLERVLGRPIRAAERAPWGFTNRTYLVTLPDGERVAIQLYSRRLTAEHRLRATARVAGLLERAGVPVPRPLVADLEAEPPFAVFAALPGVPATVFAGHELSSPSFPALARQMGELLRRIQSLPSSGLALPRLWADPPRLARRASGWLAALGGLIDDEERARVHRWLLAIPDLFADRPAVIAHGDFGPANLLVEDGRLSGLLDLEFARRADPLFDVSWWAWLVRFHAPAAFDGAWRAFVDGLHLDPTERMATERIFAMQVTRVLEVVNDAAHYGPANRSTWVDRLRATIRWEPGAEVSRGRR